MSVMEFSHEQSARFIARASCGNSEQARVFPQRLRIDKIDAVLVEIGTALLLIELEFNHGTRKIVDSNFHFKRICGLFS